MRILAFDLSSARGSLAWREGKNEMAVDWPNDRQNSGEFFKNVMDVRDKFGLPDLIVVGLGPGSYAGTRIAISTAIGLAAPGARLIGYASICAMESDTREYCVIGDARRQSFFFARIAENSLSEGPVLLSESDLAEKLSKIASTMPIFSSEQLPQFQNIRIQYPSAVLLARLAEDRGNKFQQPPLEPMYLREPHITKPKSR